MKFSDFLLKFVGVFTIVEKVAVPVAAVVAAIEPNSKFAKIEAAVVQAIPKTNEESSTTK